MDHITESMAKKILDKSALPYDFFNGAGFKESISSCIEQEVLDVRVGKKLVNDVESYFNYPKTFTAKVV
ncbi:MAG: hypothetical protein IAE90_04095 [Ignavibacteria bacterium]|nr:hypothetical protein [Ignavibacteria bacterium]